MPRTCLLARLLACHQARMMALGNLSAEVKQNNSKKTERAYDKIRDKMAAK